ncbi:type II secretory ATPase GspE/PulE/Tfp pilus assembly ATPase PilB-like protein [Cupriavidus metallidurans]|uniref:GspE/PulE family protein n=1 Tax=Cupriavidus metallidurans TaxID=119219 RepID=UPI00068E764A|nr:ATPase, T2SS/T4P/T4SS family [Cupriavidus metallidurans]
MTKSLVDVCDALVNAGEISPSQREMCLEAHSRLSDRGVDIAPEELVASYGFASRSVVEAAVNSTLGHGEKDFTAVTLPGSMMRRLGVVPIGLYGKALHLSALGSLNRAAEAEVIQEVKLAGLLVDSIINVPQDRAAIRQAINSVLAVDRALLVQDLSTYSRDTQNGNLLAKIVENLLINAVQMRASDIHITASKDRLENWIKYRIDSVVKPMFLVEPESMRVLVSRLKQDAGMDFSNTRTPQDGRFSFTAMNSVVDVRVASMPADVDEALTVRLLDPNRILPLPQLLAGHTEIVSRLERLANSVTKNGGIILVTGPTGSGKSSFLNSFMRTIDRARTRVVTAEDPIEIRVPLVLHTRINEDAGYTFAKALRSMVRQDPDVIMVGEMRDSETAEIGIRSAETGHLLLTTLHNDNVADSIARLIGMLSDSYRRIGTMAVASLLRNVLNLRLLPRLCVCARPVRFEDTALYEHAAARQKLKGPIMQRCGCSRCGNTGLYGRVPLIEAAFWPSGKEVRREMARILMSGQTADAILHLDGVFYQSSEDSLLMLVGEGLIDAQMALDVIGGASDE